MTKKTNKKYVYKVTGSCAGLTGSYYDSMDAAFDFIRMLKAGYRGDPGEFHAYIHMNDERVVEWDGASFDVQNHYGFKMGRWIKAGMPTEVPEEEEDSESELVQ